MKGLVLKAPKKIEIVDLEQPKPQAGEVLIKLKASALNKRDQFIREGKYPGIELNRVLGSDGVGEVVEAGGKEGKKWLKKTVMINPNINWGPYDSVQTKGYSILGMPSHGTFAEYVVVNVDRLVEKPSYLTDAQAAAFPLGGLTAYRACFHHGQIESDDNVLISGFGGGVAQFAFQFAKATGAQVYITSGSQAKMKQALAMGAAGAFNYKDPDWYKNAWQTKGGFDVVIDSAGGDQINNFIKSMRPAGRIVFYGATNGLPSTLDMYRMFWNQITLQGSTMGNDKEFVKMVSYISKHKIEPLIASERPFDQIIGAFDAIANNGNAGKHIVKF